nr:phage integrase SAM-like domain-containing protein [Salinisphaera hydrothermalis]
MAYQISAKLLYEFEQLKTSAVVDTSKIFKKYLEDTDKLDLGTVRKWTVDLPGIGSISTDPNASNAEIEHKQALEALKHLTESNPPAQQNNPAQANTAPVSGMGVFGSTHKPLISAFNEYIEELEAREIRSINHIKPAVNNFIEWIREQQNNIAVNQLTVNHIKQYKKYLRSAYNKRTKKTGLTEATIYKRIGFIDTFLKWCQDQQYIADGDRNLPTYKQKGQKPNAVSKGTTYKAFSQLEIAKIFDSKLFEEPPHLYISVLIGAYTGARLAEICYLNPQDIELISYDKKYFDKATITFDNRTKNNSSKRTIPIHNELSFIHLYRENLLRHYPEATTLFPWLSNPDKRVGDAFGKYLDKIGIQDRTKVFHSFRKNVSQQLKMTGCPENFANYYIGHLNKSLHNVVYAGLDEPVLLFKKHIDNIFYDIDFSEIMGRKLIEGIVPIKK